MKKNNQIEKVDRDSNTYLLIARDRLLSTSLLSNGKLWHADKYKLFNYLKCIFHDDSPRLGERS